MNYQQRLQIAAKIILEHDARDADAPLNLEELGIRATLKPHQVDGVSWLIRRYKLGVNVLLGDEVFRELAESWKDGTGQDIASYLLIELFKRVPVVSWTIFGFMSSKRNRWCSLRRNIHEHVKGQSNVLLPFDILLTTYDIALIDQDFLSQIPWQYAIIDEAQRLKTLQVFYIMFSKSIMSCQGEQFLSTFKDISDPTSVQNTVKAKDQLKILKNILGAFMLRRTKSKLIESGTLVLPSLTEITVMAPLVGLQKGLHNIVIQLRKACSHPYLFPVLSLSLMKRVNIWFRPVMTQTLDILQDFLELRKYSYVRLDGSIRAEERFAAIRSFSGPSANSVLNSEADQNGAFVFLITTRAGGVGLNLVAADTVVFYEQDWNPQVDKQALQRAHRIGQMNHVLCINLVTERTAEEVIMRRAEKKLQLSLNVIGDNIQEHEDEQKSGVGTGDLKSIILSLHMFDPNENNDGELGDMDLSEINAMTDKVIAMRDAHISDKDDQKFEINPRNLLESYDAKEGASTSFNSDPSLDEASYLSWVKKFEELSKANGDDSIMEVRNRGILDEEKHGGSPSDAGSVNFVYGDCTDPSNACPSEPAMIFSCVDTSGNWGRGGMFNALNKLSSSIGDAYERASEHGDLHLGDLHLIKLEDDCDEQNMDKSTPVWVALAVVQSYNPRRKVPRSSISLPHLESCLSKAAFSAKQNSASIHMPRVGYQDGSDRSKWYTIERLLRKYASIYGINIYVYYYRRQSQ
ncbi:hypothetical protein K1719_018058 [Acacia pycnantha]|nr:hypothetical protein K1719_018058 [Acacia pycnantha]